MKSIADLIRKLAVVGIPEEWKRDIIKPTDKIIKNPGVFVRDINKIHKYIEPMKDSGSLKTTLSDLSNTILTTAKKGRPVELTSDTQKFIVNQALQLEDEGTLLHMLSNLFSEKHEGLEKYQPPRTASIMESLRFFAETISILQ